MKIFLASAGVPREYSAIPLWQRLAAEDRCGRHTVVDAPEAADIVLFTECNQLGSDWRLAAIRESPITERFREKVYVYDQRDRPWCALPGAYASMPASSFESRYQVAVSYVPAPGPSTAYADARRRGEMPDLLASFVGSPTHRVRGEIFGLQHPRGVFERVDGFLFNDPRSKEFSSRRSHFDEVLLRSKFVLCPRGHGTSSFRLFETLACGRVPVIISDEWVPPGGPNWSEFSVRWPERDVPAGLLDHLEAIEPHAEEMGKRASEEFAAWFAPAVVFDRVATQLETLAATRTASAFPRRGVRGRSYRRMVAARTAAPFRASLKKRRSLR